MGIGYLFYFFLGRYLSPADFGSFGVLMSIFYIFSPLLSTIRTVASKFTSENIVSKNEYIDRNISNIAFNVFLLSLPFFIALLLFCIPITKFLKLNSFYLVVMIAVSVPFIFLLSFNRGHLQGTQSFFNLSINVVIGTFVKLFVGMLLVLTGLRVFGAIGGVIAGFILAFIVSIFQTKLKISFNNLKFNPGLFLGAWPLLLTFIFLIVMINVDIILVKHYFDADSAGYYNLASLFGKVLFFISLALAFVLFPKVSQLHLSKKEHLHILKDSLYFIGIIGIIVFIGYTFFADILVKTAFGPGYTVVSELLPIFGVSSILMAFSIILSFYLLAQNKRVLTWILVLLVVSETILMIFMHESLLTIAKLLLIINLIYFVLCSLLAFGYRLKNRSEFKEKPINT